MADGRVRDIYGKLKAMAVGFRLRPGERLNEGALAARLGVSRTPLREALNRLVAERLFEFRPGSGFFCRTLDPQEIFDLFELRAVIEAAAARLACERAGDDALAQLQGELFAQGLETAGLTVEEACRRDEAFHVGIARLSGNRALAQELLRINDRIRYIRWVQMSDQRIRRSKGEHVAIMAALTARDAAAAEAAVRAHIERRLDQVTEAVGKGLSTIFMDQAEAVAGRIVTGAVS